MKVVVGLGNPGRDYQQTRHNVGFMVVDYLASGSGAGPFRARFQSQVAELTEGGVSYLLVKPETFMNLSGRAVRQLVDFYKLPLEDLLVVCDDIALPLGKLRVRTGGSHGGQNGLRNIQEHLGTSDYARLRLGIGEPDAEATDHVLGRFRPGEKAAIDDAIGQAGRACLVWGARGPAACMNEFNGAGTDRPAKKKKDGATGGPQSRRPTPTDPQQPE